MVKGLIILGYQGIGKSTLCNECCHEDIIDFESSLFKIDDIRPIKWEVMYCTQALNIAKQGYTVLLSSHKIVRRELSKICDQNEVAIITIAPSCELKDKWIDKLRRRYKYDPSNKNYAALKNAEEGYCEQVISLASEPEFSHIFIHSMDYSLGCIIRNLQNIYITSYNNNKIVDFENSMDMKF